MFMAGTGVGARGCSQGPSSGSGTAGCNPRKFSEKIALHTQRQAEDTAAFQEVMMDITSTKIQAERARQARNLAPYYGGSLPNVRTACENQGQVSYNPEHSCAVCRHLMSDQSHKERTLSPPGQPSRRHTDSAPYHSVHQSPPPGSYWRRNWPNSCSADKGQESCLPTTALNRTNSDSALHTTVRNTHIGDQMSSAQPLNPRNRRSVFPYPAPLIEENLPEEGRPLKRDCKKLSEVPSGSAKSSSQHVIPTPSQQGGGLMLPSSLNMSGSLPDLSSLHLPSPQPTGLELDPLGQATCLASSSSSEHLPGSLTHPGLSTGLSPMPASLSNPLLQSSSSPNIQSSLSSNSLPSSLSSASLHLSLSNSSLKSSLSNQSLLSSLSSSSLSNQSLQSAASQCSYSSGIGGSRSCSSSSLSCSPRTSSQSHPPHSSSSRKRNQLSPLILPSGGESRWHHPKQFSPTVSPTLSSITQGVLLNTSQMSRDSRPPAYPYSQSQHAGPPLSQQPLQHLPYSAAEGHLHHQLPVVEPPVHSANHQQLPPPHQPPMPSQPAPQLPGQHQPCQPLAYPKRQAAQGHHAQLPPQPQSHLLKHLQASSPPPTAPPELQPYHARDPAASSQQHLWHQHQQHQHQQQHQYPCDPSQPLHHHQHQQQLHHTGPPPQQLYPQPVPHQQHQSQWPSRRLQPDQQAPQAPQVLHHPHQQQHQQQQQHQHHHEQHQHHHEQHQHHHERHQRQPLWSSPSPAVSGPDQTSPWLQETNLHGCLSSVGALPAHKSPRAGAPLRVQGQWRSRSQLQDAVAASAHSGSTQKMAQPPPSRTSSQGGSCLDTGICMNGESYTGLHLTPSQTKALSQQLGHLCREPGSATVPDAGMQQSADAGREPNPFQNPGPGQDQKHSSVFCHSLTDSMLTDAASWLDQEIAGFPANTLDLDEDALELSILRDDEFISESTMEGAFPHPVD